jgi:HEAT repeat protein
VSRWFRLRSTNFSIRSGLRARSVFMCFALKLGRSPENAGATGFMLTRSCLKLLSAVLLSFVPVLGTAGVARSHTCVLKEWDGTATQFSESEIIQTIQQTLYDPNIKSGYGYECSVPSKLAHIGPSVVPYLIPLLQDQDARVRHDVATTLELLGKSAQPAIPALITLFKQESRIRRHTPPLLPREGQATGVGHDYYNAYRGLLMIGEPAIPDFVRLLKDDNPSIRLETLETLGMMGASATSAIPSLIPLLKDPDADVRSSAALALSKMGESAKAAIPSLIPLLKDPEDASVRSSAAGALGNMGESAKAAIPSLIPLLKDEDEWVRLSAARALGRMGDSAKAAIPSLIPLLKDQNELVRSSAAVALGNMGESAKAEIPSLTPLLKDADADVRSSATEALKKLGYTP